MSKRTKDGGKQAAKRTTEKKSQATPRFLYSNPRQRTQDRINSVLSFFNCREDGPLDTARVSAHNEGCFPGRADTELPALWFSLNSQLCLNGDCSRRVYDPTLGEAVVAWVRRLTAQLTASADALERHMKEMPYRWEDLVTNGEFLKSRRFTEADVKAGRVAFSPDEEYEEQTRAIEEIRRERQAAAK